MNKIKTLLALSLVGMALIGCTESKKNTYFNSDYEVIENPKPPRALNGVRIIDGDTLEGFGGWSCIADKLVWINLEDKSNVFAIYNSQGHLISSFGRIGNATNEFSKGMDFTFQTEQGKFWVNDVNKAALMRIDLQASLDSSTCVVDKRITTAGRVINAFFVDDSTIIYEQELKDSYRLFVYDTKHDSPLQRYDLYAPCKNYEAFNIYYSHLLLHPDKNRLVGVMTKMNQVNFLSVRENKRKAVSLYEEAEPCYDYEKQTYFYCSVTATRDRVYVLYLNQSNEESFEVAKPVEIHVFDWDGNFIERLQANEYVTNIFVDENGEYLYGRIPLNNDVYKYKL